MTQTQTPAEFPQGQHVRTWDAVIEDLWDEREWALEHRGGPMRSYQEWISLIAEEVGEAAKDANQLYWGGWRGNEADCEKELLQVAQLAISAIIWGRTRREAGENG